MNEWSQTAYFPTAHIFSCCYYYSCSLNLKHLYWHHKCYCSLKNILHTQYSCILMTICTPNFTYLAPLVYWISEWVWKRISHICHIIIIHYMRIIAFKNFNNFWRSIIIHPPLQLSNSHNTCCSSLIGWHTYHVTFTDCKKWKCMIPWDGI
jgi:hypothetical protein